MEIGNIETAGYWQERYDENTDTWSLGSHTPAFRELLEAPPFDFGRKMIIPGCGLGHDAALAAAMGYDVTAMDFASGAEESALRLCAAQEAKFNFLRRDIFEENNDLAGQFDTLFEHTLLCAVPPQKRADTLAAFARLLKPGGHFISLLFPINPREGGPPFTVPPEEIYELAKKHFTLLLFSRRVNSIKPRKGREVLFIFRKTN